MSMTISQLKLLPALALAGVMALAQPSGAQSVAIVAAELGITPESLVIAEVDQVIGVTILQRLEAATELRANLVAHRQAASEAVGAIGALRAVMSDQAHDQDTATQYNAAVEQLETIKDQIQQLRQALFNVAMDGAPPVTLERLAAWRSGRGFRVAPEFRCRTRDDHAWKAIQRALRAEKRATRLGRDLAGEHAELLATVRSDPVVVQATFALSANLDAMKAVFAQFSD